MEVASYDLPAQIGKVQAVTGAEKITYMGYSHGSFLMFLGLAMSQEANNYYADNLKKFIALAPCIYYESEFETSEELIAVYKLYEQKGVYWTTAPIKSENEKWEEMQLGRSESTQNKDKRSSTLQPMSVASQFYIEQIAMERTFQEYKPLESYASTLGVFSTWATPLDLGQVKNVNIHMIVPEYDDVCLPAHSVLIFDELGTEQKTMRYIRHNEGLPPEHDYFEKVGGNRFVTELIRSIQEDSEDDIAAMEPFEVAGLYIAG